MRYVLVFNDNLPTVVAHAMGMEGFEPDLP